MNIRQEVGKLTNALTFHEAFRPCFNVLWVHSKTEYHNTFL